MLMIAICFVLGELGFLLTFSFGRIITLAGVVLIAFSYSKKNGVDVLLLLLVFLYIAGFYSASFAMEDGIVESYGVESLDALVTGQVSAIEKGSSGYRVYIRDVVVRVEEDDAEIKGNSLDNNALVNSERDLDLVGLKTDETNRCKDYKLSRKILLRCDECSFKLGQRIRVDGKLSCLAKKRNPGEFDAFNYYRARNVDSVLKANDIELVDASYWHYLEGLRELRENLVLRCRAMLSSEDAGLIESIVLGYRADLDEDVKTLYQSAGIAHIIAISGLHVGLVGVFIYGLFRKLGLTIGLSAFLAGGLIVSYALFTGMSGSCERAMVMLLVAYLAKVIGRAYDMLSAMSLAALIVLFMSPLQILDAGFLLSFGAVIGISAVYPVIRGESSSKVKLFTKIIDSFFISISVELITLPIIAKFYYEIPVYSVIIGLIVIPLMSFLVAFAVLGISLTFINVNWAFIAFVPSVLVLRINKFLCLLNERLPASNIVTGEPGFGIIAFYYIVLAIVLYIYYAKNDAYKKLVKLERIDRLEDMYEFYKGRYIYLKRLFKRALACILVIGLLVVLWNNLLVNSTNSFAKLEIDVLDVGQGDGIVIKTPSKEAILVDGGSTSNNSLYKYTYLPYLKSQGITRISASIISHSDMDHISAIKELIENDFVIELLVLPDIANPDDNYRELCELAFSHGIELKKVYRGMKIEIDGLTLDIMHPYKGYETEDANEYSTTFVLNYGEFRMLFTGDLGGEGEEGVVEFLEGKSDEGEIKLGKSIDGESNMVKSVDNNSWDIDILKVGHHGSKTSTSDELLELFDPECAIISVGKYNKYGHPSDLVIDRLKEHACDIYRTDQSGAIRVKVGLKGYSVEGMN